MDLRHRPLSAAPTRVAGEIRLGAPEHQDLAIVLCSLRDETRFVAFHATRLTHQVGVPGFAHARGLRELRGGDGCPDKTALGTALNYAVYSFGAAKVRDAQPRHPGAGAKTIDFLFYRHERKKIVDSLFDRQGWILEGIAWLPC